MHLRWTEAAATDLERIADNLFSHAPDRAPRLIKSVYEAPETLLSFPRRGRPGKKAGTGNWCFRPCHGSWSTPCATTSSTSFAGSMERNDGPDEWHATRPDGADCQRAMAGNARRQRRHPWHSRQCGFCSLQIPKDLIEFESHPLRQTHLRHHGAFALLG
jgi:plasmid stabilization system protein ParE